MLYKFTVYVFNVLLYCGKERYNGVSGMDGIVYVSAVRIVFFFMSNRIVNLYSAEVQIRPGLAAFKLFFAMIAYRTNHICIVRTNLREMAPY